MKRQRYALSCWYCVFYGDSDGFCSHYMGRILSYELINRGCGSFEPVNYNGKPLPEIEELNNGRHEEHG